MKNNLTVKSVFLFGLLAVYGIHPVEVKKVNICADIWLCYWQVSMTEDKVEMQLKVLLSTYVRWLINKPKHGKEMSSDRKGV